MAHDAFVVLQFCTIVIFIVLLSSAVFGNGTYYLKVLLVHGWCLHFLFLNARWHLRLSLCYNVFFTIVIFIVIRSSVVSSCRCGTAQTLIAGR